MRFLLPAALVLASAALHSLAFPPVGLSALAWVSLAPLLIALTRVGAVAGACLGTAWSLAVGCGTAAFLPAMVSDYFGASAAGAWLAATLATLATGIWYGLFGAWLAWVAKQRPISPLAVACGFCACEFARTWAWLPNPWAISAVTQAGWPTALQIADLGGPSVIGMALAACNAFVAAPFTPALRPARARSAVSGAAAVLLLVGGYGQWRLHQDFATGEEIDVALVQSSVPREQRWQPSHGHRNLRWNLALAEHAMAEGPDLVLLSEFAFDFPFELGRRSLARLSTRGDSELLVGAQGARDSGVPQRYFNSYFVVRHGEVVDHYDKVSLMPFSEVDPLPGISDFGRERYAAGSSHRPVQSGVGPIGILLCNEAMLPELARTSTLLGAQLLANPANDEWFGAAGAEHQLALAVLRAVENRRFLVRPTQTGITAVVDPWGRVVARESLAEPRILRASVRMSSDVTPFHRIGSALPLAAFTVALLVTADRARAVRQGRPSA